MKLTSQPVNRQFPLLSTWADVCVINIQTAAIQTGKVDGHRDGCEGRVG